MKTLLVILMLSGLAAPAAAQTPSSNPAPSAPIPTPLQSLGNIVRNPDAPPPPQPRQGSGEPLRLPTIIPPNTIGTGSGR